VECNKQQALTSFYSPLAPINPGLLQVRDQVRVEGAAELADLPDSQLRDAVDNSEATVSGEEDMPERLMPIDSFKVILTADRCA